ncbi:MAG: hypothetical protein FJ220_02005, partial [Kiritimatiellaceae bacterium]|nr:hypothetical protein [Kiritimatiellaceae bacterium]
MLWIEMVFCVKHHAPPDFPYYVTSLAQAPDETLWIGSTVLHRYDPSSQTARQLPEFQGLNTIDIAFDQQATQWVAKEHAGVYRYQTNQWTQFATQDGLAGINLSDLLVLRDQTVLAASGFGISRFDGDSWTTHAFPQEWSLASRWSGMRESRDGSIWFNVSDREAQSAQLTVNQTERFYTVRHIADTDAPDTHVTAWLDRVAQPGNCHISWSTQDPWSC